MNPVENPHGYALDDFGGRLDDDEIGDLVERRPHQDVVFDHLFWSRYTPAPPQAWRFIYACITGCPNGIISMPVTIASDSHPKECPDCGGRVSRLSRAWNPPATGETGGKGA